MEFVFFHGHDGPIFYSRVVGETEDGVDDDVGVLDVVFSGDGVGDTFDFFLGLRCVSSAGEEFVVFV